MTLVRDLYTKLCRVGCRHFGNRRTKNSDGEGDVPDPSEMSASRKRKLSDGDSETEPVVEKPTSLFLALDNAPLPTTYAKIEAFFLPLRLKTISIDFDYGVVKAPQVEFYARADRDEALQEKQNKVFGGQRLFLRSPEDMQATKPGCGWEMVHPILQRELFSHFNVFNRSRLQRVSTSWKHNLDNLDTRVKETLCFPTGTKYDEIDDDYTYQFMWSTVGSFRHIVFYRGFDELQHRLIESCFDCGLVSFVDGEYTEKWITGVARHTTANPVELRFINCRIKLSCLSGRLFGPLAKVHRCELKVRNLCLPGKIKISVSTSYRLLYAALEKEYSAWNLAAWNDWWTQNKGSSDSALFRSMTAFFDTDIIRKFLMSKNSGNTVNAKDFLLHNIRDCIFLRNFCSVYKVSLPRALEDMFPNTEYDSGVFNRQSNEVRDASIAQPHADDG